MRHFDAVIVGGGAAGATVARLLAGWGHAVTVLTPAASSGSSFAECLPPSTQKLFGFLGLREAIDRAGYFRTSGNTVWWGNSRRRVEPYPEGYGYEVLRPRFDSLLVDLAREAGARVQHGRATGSFDQAQPRIIFDSNGEKGQVESRFVLDCSGRAGVLGRFLRINQPKSRTAALCGVWKSQSGWKLPDPSHTLVESYGDGWAWSVPLSPYLRHVAVMVEPGVTRMVRGKGLAITYHAELAKTRAFRRIFEHSILEQKPWGRPASLYTSCTFGGPGFLLVGDAASTIDPLSSFGVKKAMVSAWVAAVVANTCLRNPGMQAAALQFYQDREARIYRDWLRLSAAWLQKGGYDPFWEYRDASTDLEEHADSTKQEGVRKSWEELKSKASIRLRLTRDPLQPKAAIEGNQIVMREPMIGAVHLDRLCEIAGQHSQVPDLYEAYNRACEPVALAEFAAALATLLAEKVLTNRP